MKKDGDYNSWEPEKDPGYDKVKSRQEHSDKARNVLRGAGYARGGGVGAKKKHPLALHSDTAGETPMMKSAKKRAAKFASGGHVKGDKPKARPDKMARGGSKPRGHTKVNINVGAGEQEKKQAMQAGVQLGARMAAAKMAGGMPRPGAGAPMQARPMGPPPGGGPGMPPPGGMPGAGGPPPMAARGGRMYAKGGKVGPKRVPGTPHLMGAAAGGLGRIEKAKAYGGKPIGKGVKLTTKQKI
jgi:translation initiation factor IF-2